jgi:hypothetical protein
MAWLKLGLCRGRWRAGWITWVQLGSWVGSRSLEKTHERYCTDQDPYVSP